jgi:hypothetical protein
MYGETVDQTTSSPIRSLRILIAFKHFAVYLDAKTPSHIHPPCYSRLAFRSVPYLSQSSTTNTTRNMKITTILPILAATLATSSILPGFASKSQAIISSELSVPGKNPLNFCADPANFVLTIDHVDLSPNPPVPGQTLNISAAGAFNYDVEPGATVFLQVKFGLITLIKTEADLCDQLGNVDVTCPLEKGNMTLSKSVNIPERVPKGKYTVIADVKTVDGDPVTCMTSEISFS